jgi:hypothetical protein
LTLPRPQRGQQRPFARERGDHWRRLGRGLDRPRERKRILELVESAGEQAKHVLVAQVKLGARPSAVFRWGRRRRFDAVLNHDEAAQEFRFDDRGQFVALRVRAAHRPRAGAHRRPYARARQLPADSRRPAHEVQAV